MKTLKFTLAIFVIAFFACSNAFGQVVHQDIVVTIDHFDYGTEIGIVNGTYTYRFTFRLSKTGELESLHWNVIACDLVNDKGDKVKVIDSGHDTYGLGWYLWNNINAFNEGLPINYEGVEDGWLDDILPASMPEEGTYVNMVAEVLCKGKSLYFGCMYQLHINANGEITAEVVKNPWW